MATTPFETANELIATFKANAERAEALLATNPTGFLIVTEDGTLAIGRDATDENVLRMVSPIGDHAVTKHSRQFAENVCHHWNSNLKPDQRTVRTVVKEKTEVLRDYAAQCHKFANMIWCTKK